MSAASTKQPLGLDTALRDFSKSLGITKKLREYSVVTSWEKLVGEQIAKVTTPQRIENGMLQVSVSNAPWRNELSMRKREIIEKINNSLGKKVIVDIRFR
jgi:predicted nucleic acid-binding Zn ribbon protein